MLKYNGKMFEWVSLVIDIQLHLSNVSTISWREQVNFNWDDDEVHFVLDQHALYDFNSVSSIKQQSWRWTRTHYSDSEATSLYSFPPMLSA